VPVTSEKTWHLHHYAHRQSAETLPSLITVSGISRNMRNSVASCFLRIRPHAGRGSGRVSRGLYFDLRGNPNVREGGSGVIRTAIRQSLKISVSEGSPETSWLAQCEQAQKPSCFIEIQDGRRARVLFSARKQMACRELGQRWRKRSTKLVRFVIGQIAEVSPRQLSLFAGKAPAALGGRPRHRRPSCYSRGPGTKVGVPGNFHEDVTDEDWVLGQTPVNSGSSLGKVRGEGKDGSHHRSPGFDITISTIATKRKPGGTDGYGKRTVIMFSHVCSKRLGSAESPSALVSVKLSGGTGVVFSPGLPASKRGL